MEPELSTFLGTWGSLTYVTLGRTSRLNVWIRNVGELTAKIAALSYRRHKRELRGTTILRQQPVWHMFRP